MIMNDYDIIVVGMATTGSYFARKMAEKGYKVLVIDKLPEEKVGCKYDIVHMLKSDFDRFGLPKPEKGDDFAFEFTGGITYSAFGNYPKEGYGTTVGMHLHNYTLHLNRWAAEAGVSLSYETEFNGILWRKDKIAGVKIHRNGKAETLTASLVVDASGIPSVVREKLPASSFVENFVIKPEEMFYVILHYVKYKNKEDFVKVSRGWLYYKTWEAPEADPEGAILGIGAIRSYAEGEKIYKEFIGSIQLPEYENKYVEKGRTPFRRAPYSFVDENFLVLGDAACVNKPYNGEGITASMIHCDIAVRVIDELLKANKPLTVANMWPINKSYYSGLGKIYAGMRATLVGAIATNKKENEYFFKKDIIFSAKSFANMGDDLPIKYSGGELFVMIMKIVWGIMTFKLRFKTIKSLLNGMKSGDKISALYDRYPETTEGFAVWKEEADKLWKSSGSIADVKYD